MNTNASLQARKEQAFARGQGNLTQVYVQKALNSEIWDVEGKRYIDFAAGIAVTNTGHAHPKVLAAAIAQMENFSHTCVMVTPYAPAVELAERLNEIAPITDARTIFVTTGAEAVENTIKIARAHTGRPGVIAFNGGFHGRTNMCMGLTGKVVPYKAGFGPFPNDIYHVPFPIEYHGITPEQSLTALKNLFVTDIEPEQVAAIIIEPVQGEGGFYAVPDGFMAELRLICDQHGIVLISDEIQSGFGRTGKMFATEYSGVEPDLIPMAKGLAGGFPIAAVVGKAEIMNAANPGGLGGTYAGSVVGCASALAVLDVIEEERLCERANQIGETIMAHLGELQQQYPERIGHIRNLGAMIAMELVHHGDSNQPDSVLPKALIAAAAEKGLILLSCGIRSNVIRILTPLTIQQDILQEGLGILSEVFAEAV